MPQDFNSDYYAAMAQVLPVLFLALVFQYRLFQPRSDESAQESLWLLMLVTLLLGGEVVVLSALADQEEPSRLLEAVPWLALSGAFFGFAYPIVRPRLEALQRTVPHAKLIGNVLLVGGVVSLLLANFGVLDPDAWLTALLWLPVLLYALAVLVGFWQEARALAAPADSDGGDADAEEKGEDD